ncbi:copper ion binding protein [Cohnella terricola]|uniref:Heavy-metal-associated domain-containing protein n=1 Tax=Cohnella terricola TaxID=1289167 RepID=A0A559JPX8_9BACL|nr:copper ion binding protein [Cohnella terricola]TVY01932.1 heavy-metal-associated domain-containing protein [Cohnella terricola]
MSNVTLKVQGMSCGHCVNAVEGAVRRFGADAQVDLAKGTVAIVYDDGKVSLESIKEAIEDQGYDVG